MGENPLSAIELPCTSAPGHKTAGNDIRLASSAEALTEVPPTFLWPVTPSGRLGMLWRVDGCACTNARRGRPSRYPVISAGGVSPGFPATQTGSQRVDAAALSRAACA